MGTQGLHYDSYSPHDATGTSGGWGAWVSNRRRGRWHCLECWGAALCSDGSVGLSIPTALTKDFQLGRSKPAGASLIAWPMFWFPIAIGQVFLGGDQCCWDARWSTTIGLCWSDETPWLKRSRSITTQHATAIQYRLHIHMLTLLYSHTFS